MLAPEDLKALAVGFVRHIPVVSDDRALRQVATTHGVECWETMKLLKLMVDCGRITISKVNEILEYLDNENDLPAGRAELRVQYKELFDLQCPL
jgi:predicted nucleic acid-binding protein